MYINLKAIETELGEFVINKDITQAKILLNVEYPKNDTRLYFLNKVICDNGTTAILIKNVYNTEEKISISSSHDTYDFLMGVDYSNNTIVYDGHCNIDFEKLQNDLSEFKFYVSNELAKEINNKYEDEIIKLFNNNFGELMKIDVYKNEYDRIMSESYKTVENLYLNNDVDYKLTVKGLENFSFNDLEDLQKYISNPSIINEFAEEYYKKILDKKGYYLFQHAKIMAYKELLNNIKNNPSERVQFVKTIKDSITEAGKTLNVVTKDGNTVKVENKIIDNQEFRTCTGWNYINLNDVKQITFGKKVLYTVE